MKMMMKDYFMRKFNFKTTEASAEVMLAALILAGWLASTAVYLIAN
jgi:hypothetical protein